MPRRALLPLLPLLALAALPGAASAACNPTGTEECCTKHVSVECDSVTWPTAEGASAEPGCDEVSFTLDGIVNGRFFATKTTEWTQNDPETDCPDPQTEPVEGAVVPEVTWEIFHNGVSIRTGEGTSALATNVSGGTVRCEFTMTSTTEWCGEDTKTYEASTNLPTASLLLPEIVGRNDLVEPCEDPTDFVSSVEELAADEEDLYTLSWSVSPEADEVTIFSETADKLRVLVADGSRLATTFHHPPMPEETEIWLEGIHRSDETNDCTVTMAYRIGELLCEISATTTVVSVELDKFCYNRMDPHPEVRITNVVNLVPGGTATVWCAVSPDVVEADPDGFSETFAVSSAPGTHVFRTREVENRFRNKGWDVLRYTVYVGENGERRLAAGVSTPSHDAVETPPPECLATVLIGDAFASTPEEALGHLDSTPEIEVPHAEGSKPDYTVPEIKLFKKGASLWHTNEMHLADLGATAVREVLLDETQDTAVGLELTVPEVVAVNDRYDAGDPGKNAAIDLVPSDPDFSTPLSVAGIPDCVVTGTVTWTVSRGANLVFIKGGEMLVGSSFTFPYPGAPTPRLEGRTASEEKNDVVVTFELLCAAEGNPAAFRGQTLKAVGRTTVVDTRWTHHRPDGAGKSGERYDLLECDLDLRPSVRIDSFGAEPGGPFVVEGTVTSMIDLPTDVRVNGTPVAATNLLVGGRTVEEALADGTWGLEPPYEVSFRHEMPSFSGETLEVAAFGSVSAHPGFHRFRGLGSGATNEVRSPVLASPTMTGFYGDFLYKFEADHAGSGLGFLDCAEGLRCGAQSTNLPLYRLERTLLFLPPDADGPGGTRTEGFQIEDTPSGAPARGAYTALGLDDGSSATSISSIFPCDLDVKGGDGIVVPDCDEWWLGAFTEPGKTATLVVSDALETAGIPTNGVATLSKTSDVGGVFPDFQTLTWRYGEPPPSAEALVLTAAAPGVATFELRLSGEELASWDRVKITSLLVDVDVDSDNDNGFDAPSRSDDEDAVEDNAPGDGGTSGGDAGVPGKILPVDSGDVDGDGIPDFADGYSLFPGNADMVSCEGARFAPVVFELPEPFDPATATIWVSYDASDPRLVTTNAAGGYEPASGGRLRIWARNGGVARSATPLLEGGDYLAPGAYAPATLGITPGSRSATFYMEAVRKSESAGDIRIDFTARPEPYPSTAPSIVDTVLATASMLDIELPDVEMLQGDLERKEFTVGWEFASNVTADWHIEPVLENGARLHAEETGDEGGSLSLSDFSTIWVSAGSISTNYTLIATNHAIRTVFGGATVSVLPFRIVPDYDFDNEITDSDCLEQSTNRIFRIWINNDYDDYESDSGSGKEVPEYGYMYADYSDHEVNGNRDRLDWFPLWLDLQAAFRIYPLSEGYEYWLVQDDDAVACLWTSLAKPTAGKFQIEDSHCFGDDFQDSMLEARVARLSSGNLQLPSQFLAIAQSDSERGIILVEGQDNSCSSLKLEIRRNDEIVSRCELPLNCSSVEEMFRFVNLRPVTGGSASPSTRIEEPSNRPFTPNGKNVFLVHGFLVEGNESRGWGSEFFKKLLRSGSHADFWMVTWKGDPRDADYYWAVNHAFLTAPALASTVNAVSGEKTVMSHSLGNMVVSSALQDCGMNATHYLALNAAVATEAFDPSCFVSSTTTANSFLHEDWLGFTNKSWSASWFQLFPTNDARRKLSWQNRFKDIPRTTDMVNFWSSGDEVLEIATDGTPYIIEMLWRGLGKILPFVHTDMRRNTWQKQEFYKGRNILYGSGWAGWGFETNVTAEAVNAAPVSVLRDSPVFEHDPDEMFSSSITEPWVNLILAKGIPALSPPLGARSLNTVESIDMNDVRDIPRPNNWCRDSPLYGAAWLHTDIQNVAYFFTHKVFDKIVEKGNLK